MKKLNSLIFAATGALALSVQAQSLLVNGNFDSGNLNGWIATSTQQTSFQASLNDGQNSQVVNGGGSGGPVWYVRNKPATYSNWQTATPISGYSAFNGFDGDTGVFTLKQSFTVSGPVSTALLDFTFGWQSQYSGLNRTLDVNILNAAGTSILYNAYGFILPQGTHTTWTINSQSLDISSTLNSLGAGNYMLAFQETIPQSYTGPAQFAIDNISLSVTPVPEPSTMALAGLGGVGLFFARRRKN